MSSIDRQAVAARIRELIGQGTQRAFAERIDVPPQAVTKYLRGVLPDHEVLMRVARACNVTIEWLLAGEEPRIWHEPSEAAVIGRRIRALREEIGLSRRQFADRLQTETASEIERYEAGEEEAPKIILDRIARRWNAEYEWLAAGKSPKWRLFGRYSSAWIVLAIRELMPNICDFRPVAYLFETVDGNGWIGCQFVLEASGGEKYYTLAGTCSPLGGHGSQGLVDGICELRDEWGVLIRGLKLPPASFHDLSTGNLYAGRAISTVSLVHDGFDPISQYIEDLPGMEGYRAKRREEMRRQRLSEQHEQSKQQEVNAALYVTELENRLKRLDQVVTMTEKLDTLRAMIRVIEGELQSSGAKDD